MVLVPRRKRRAQHYILLFWMLVHLVELVAVVREVFLAHLQRAARVQLAARSVRELFQFNGVLYVRHSSSGFHTLRRRQQ